MTKAATETDRIAELEATVLALTKRVNESEARLDEQSGAIGALAAASMVLQLAMRIKDVGKRLGFAEHKQTIESALLMQQWPAEGERASKMLAAAQQTAGAAFGWIEKMMQPLLEAWNVQMAEERMREEEDRQFRKDQEHGIMPLNFFEKLKGAGHRTQIGSVDDIRQGNAPSTARMNRFYTP